MNLEKLKRSIRNVPDFPKPGIQFKDITTLLDDIDLFNESINAFYQEFKKRVLDGRPKLNAEELDDLALGRVWTGNEAFNNGLIDEIGGITLTVEKDLKYQDYAGELSIDIKKGKQK